MEMGRKKSGNQSLTPPPYNLELESINKIPKNKLRTPNN